MGLVTMWLSMLKTVTMAGECSCVPVVPNGTGPDVRLMEYTVAPWHAQYNNNHCVNRVSSVEIPGYKKRTTEVDIKGHYTVFRDYYDNMHSLATRLQYDQYGNVITMRGPNTTVHYTYDNFVHSYPTAIADTFGNDIIPKYSFNAKELDEETGMYYYEARYYKPPVFTSRDPMFEKYFWMTPYAYCANNPIKYVDPSGNEAWEPDKYGNLIAEDGDNAEELSKCMGISLEEASELLIAQGCSTENVPKFFRVKFNVPVIIIHIRK